MKALDEHMEDVTDEVRKFLSKIGSKGGLSKSAKKARAARRNIAKAREVEAGRNWVRLIKATEGQIAEARRDVDRLVDSLNAYNPQQNP